MKHIKFYEEVVEEINDNDDSKLIFESDEWLIVKPESFDSLLYWSKGTKWIIEDINSKYHASVGLSPERYRMNNSIYVNINKQNNDKYLFDFDKVTFIDINDEKIYLYNIFNDNKELLNVYGEIIESNHVVKENDDSYWIVVPDYDFFIDYFNVDSHYRRDLVKKVLSGDVFDVFSYNLKDFDINNSYINLKDNNIYLLKAVLFLQKLSNNEYYDYDIADVKDYYDVVDIINEYDIEEFENRLLMAICEATEASDGDAAFDDILNEVFSFFNLIKDSVKWQGNKNSNNHDLWIKFKTKEDAYKTKFYFNDYDGSFSDEKIDYTPPYYGYSGDPKVFNDTFNDILLDKMCDYDSSDVSGEDIYELYNYIIKYKKSYPDNSEEDMFSEYEIYKNAKKYNL